MNQVVEEVILPNAARLQLVQGDLTSEAVDAIVNAANAYLQHGGGVAGAIVQRGGSQIQAESDAWVKKQGPVTHAEPAYTRAGRLPCRYVIHAVGPVWGEGDEDARLTAAVQGSLRLAGRLELSSIAFPAISTGIFGFPKLRAARVILESIQAFFSQEPASPLQRIRIVVYDVPTAQAFIKTWEQIFFAG